MEILAQLVSIIFLILAVVCLIDIYQEVRDIYGLHQIEKGIKEATKYMKGYIETK